MGKIGGVVGYKGHEGGEMGLTRNEFVALEIVSTTLLEKDVGFVKKENCIPFCAHFKYVGEGRFNLRGTETKIPCTHHVERSTHGLRNRFCGQSLAYAGRTAEKHDHSFALEQVSLV